MTDNDDTLDSETRPPRSVAVIETAEELGIELSEYDPVLDGVEGVDMPPKPDDSSDESE